jgi:hypothetical protein
MQHIRIIKTPAGEAPFNVRAAWVGVTLPLAIPGPRITHGVGVLTGPRSTFERLVHLFFGKSELCRGYIVHAETAVTILEKNDPDAARWWRENAVEIIRPGECLIFAENECEVMA